MTWPAVMPPSDDRSPEARRMRLEILAEWMVTPSTIRAAVGMPSSQQGLADLLGVHAVTISAYKKDPTLQDLIAAQVRSNVAATDFSEIIQNLVKIAKSETAQAVPAAREVLRWFRESRPQGESNSKLSSLSDSELEKMLREDSH